MKSAYHKPIPLLVEEITEAPLMIGVREATTPAWGAHARTRTIFTSTGQQQLKVGDFVVKVGDEYLIYPRMVGLTLLDFGDVKTPIELFLSIPARQGPRLTG